MNLEEIRATVATDLAATDHLIRQELASDVVMINQLGQYIVGSGGKRLRPLLVLLASRALGYPGEEHIALAGVIEFIHTATLLHDDVVDDSKLRRGQQTANAIWGNEASVLVGDFLYSRAFQLMVKTKTPEVLGVMADATNAIAEGEVLQLLHTKDLGLTEAEYLNVIERKTAKLFEAATHIGALLADVEPEMTTHMASFGRNLGICYQLIDDMLDYFGDPAVIGKNIGDDLSDGKLTLPIIHVLNHGSTEQQALIKQIFEAGQLEDIASLQTAMTSTGAIEYTRNLASHYAQQAFDALESVTDSPYRQALCAVTDFSLSRDH